MTPGQRFNFDIFLAPYGLSANDFYTFLAAMAAFFTVMAVGRTLIVRNTFSSRVKLLQERRNTLRNELSGPKRRRKREETVNFMRHIVNRLHLVQKGHMSDLTNQLVSAGMRSKDAIYIFTFFRFALPIMLTILAVCYLLFFLEDAKFHHWLLPLFTLYIGYRLPDFVVDYKRKKRYVLIQRALADTLDLLMICAEAGLSLAQGLERVSRELKNAYPEMADELALTSIELSFQPDRQKTLNGLAQRVQLSEVKGIVNVLIQTEKYGTPIAQALRTLSAEFRTQRMLRAEQKAARLPAIMTVPMIIFILPTLFIVVIAPAAIQLMGTMAGAD
jgi:tight adherence protein C